MILEIFLSKLNMAKHRSKKDRIRASLRRPTATSKDVPVLVQRNYLMEIFAYDPKLVIKDLKKTLLVFGFILLILLTVALLYT